MSPKLLVLICFTCVLALQGCAVLFVAGTAATAVALHDRRDISTQVEDTGVEISINNALSKIPELADKGRIRVFAVNGRVLLVGQVASHQLKSQADSIARQQKAVNRVYNELQIAKPIPISKRTEDSWISTKARADLIANKEMDFVRVKVITENQRIYLMGVLTSAEADLATEITRNVSGVKEVIRVFELVN